MATVNEHSGQSLQESPRSKPARRTPAINAAKRRGQFAKERQQKAVSLRKRGYSYPLIAQALGVNVSTAYRDVQAALAEVAEQLVEETKRFRAMESIRLDSLIAAWWDKAVDQGNPKAMGALLRAIELRLRVLGIEIGKPTGQPGDADLAGMASGARAAVSNFIGISIGAGVAVDPTGAGVGGTMNGAGLPGSSLQGADPATLRAVLEARLKVPAGALPMAAVERAIAISPGVELLPAENVQGFSKEIHEIQTLEVPEGTAGGE